MIQYFFLIYRIYNSQWSHSNIWNLNFIVLSLLPAHMNWGHFKEFPLFLLLVPFSVICLVISIDIPLHAAANGCCECPIGFNLLHFIWEWKKCWPSFYKPMCEEQVTSLVKMKFSLGHIGGLGQNWSNLKQLSRWQKAKSNCGISLLIRLPARKHPSIIS